MPSRLPGLVRLVVRARRGVPSTRRARSFYEVIAASLPCEAVPTEVRGCRYARHARGLRAGSGPAATRSVRPTTRLSSCRAVSSSLLGPVPPTTPGRDRLLSPSISELHQGSQTFLVCWREVVHAHQVGVATMRPSLRLGSGAAARPGWWAWVGPGPRGSRPRLAVPAQWRAPP